METLQLHNHLLVIGCLSWELVIVGVVGDFGKSFGWWLPTWDASRQTFLIQLDISRQRNQRNDENPPVHDNFDGVSLLLYWVWLVLAKQKNGPSFDKKGKELGQKKKQKKKKKKTF